MEGKVSRDESKIALQLFTVLRVCLIRSVDINLFFIREPKTGTKLIGIWQNRKNTQFVISF